MKSLGAGEPRTVDAKRDATRLRGSVDGRSVDMELVEIAGELLLRAPDGKARPVSAVRDGAVIWVQSGASVWRFEEIRTGRKKAHAAGHDELIAPMPSKVVRVEVEAGATVSAGAPLIVLEAMKMEHTLRAPHDGVVTAVLVAVGEMVAMGQRLMDVDAPPAE